MGKNTRPNGCCRNLRDGRDDRYANGNFLFWITGSVKEMEQKSKGEAS
jgi:hypothetical protein